MSKVREGNCRTAGDNNHANCVKAYRVLEALGEEQGQIRREGAGPSTVYSRK